MVAFFCLAWYKMNILSLNKNAYQSILAILFVMCCYFALMEITRLSIIDYYAYCFDVDFSNMNFNEIGIKLGFTNLSYMLLYIQLRRPIIVITFILFGLIIIKQKANNYGLEFLFGLLLASQLVY